MEPKFKVGDEVICIKINTDYDYTELMIGRVYKIFSIFYDAKERNWIRLKGLGYAYLENDFILSNEVTKVLFKSDKNC